MKASFSPVTSEVPFAEEFAVELLPPAKQSQRAFALA